MRIALLTSGGDCPGLNAVIRAAVRRSLNYGHHVVAVRGGWRGLVEGTFTPLGPREISGILPLGGTIIRCARGGPFDMERGLERTFESWWRNSLDGLIAIGGDGSLTVASRLHEEYGLGIVGVPKTIDNDLGATDYTFGFDTAVTVCTKAIDGLHSTAESHHRVVVVEVMGRHAGWIAVMSGIAGGADVILIPEHPMTVEACCRLIEKRHGAGKTFSIVVVSEGYPLTFESGEERAVTLDSADAVGRARLGGVGAAVAQEIEARTGYEARVTALGHVQRGGTPTARDRILATRYGLKAADLVHQGLFGRMPALRGDDVVDVSLKEATAAMKGVPDDWYELAKVSAGFEALDLRPAAS